MQQCAFQCLTLMHCQRVMKSVEQEARLSGHSWAFGQPRELAEWRQLNDSLSSLEPHNKIFELPENMKELVYEADSKLLERGEYPQLMGYVEKIRNNELFAPDRKVLVYGSPGCGKSKFLEYYLIYLCKTKATVIYSSFAAKDVVLLSPGLCSAGPVEAFKTYLMDPNVVYLCDSHCPSQAAAVTVVAATRHKDGGLDEYRKRAHRDVLPDMPREDIWKIWKASFHT